MGPPPALQPKIFSSKRRYTQEKIDMTVQAREWYPVVPFKEDGLIESSAFCPPLKEQQQLIHDYYRVHPPTSYFFLLTLLLLLYNERGQAASWSPRYRILVVKASERNHQTRPCITVSPTESTPPKEIAPPAPGAYNLSLLHDSSRTLWFVITSVINPTTTSPVQTSPP